MFDGISPLTFVRLVLILVGGGLFLYGVSIDNGTVRAAAIGVMAISFLLRFVRRGR